MISVITGKLGAGKTYFTVNYIVRKFYHYDDLLINYAPTTDCRIVSNIRGLRLPHENLDDLVCDDGGFPDIKKMQRVFSAEFVGGKKNVVFVIDEAQRYFPRKFYDVPIFTFFQKSRQEGVDILMITQDIQTLAKEMQTLCEYEIRAVQRAKRSRNIFVYKYFLEFEVFRTVTLHFRRDIALLYESRVREETQKMSFVYTRYLLVVGACCILGIICFRFAMGHFFHMKGPSKVFSSAPAASVAPVGRILSPSEIKDLVAKQKTVTESVEDRDAESTSGKNSADAQIVLAGSFISNGIRTIVYPDSMAGGGGEADGLTAPSSGSGSPSSTGGNQGPVESGSTNADAGLNGPAMGSGLAPSYHGASGPYTWHPVASWITVDGVGLSLVDWKGRIVGVVKSLP